MNTGGPEAVLLGVGVALTPVPELMLIVPLFLPPPNTEDVGLPLTTEVTLGVLAGLLDSLTEDWGTGVLVSVMIMVEVTFVVTVVSFEGVLGLLGVGDGLVKSHLVHGTVTVTVVGPLPQPDWHTFVVVSQP